MTESQRSERIKRPRWVGPTGVICIAFGLVTIIVGGITLFGRQAPELPRGIVPFVLWFNFLAGFAYVAAGAGLFHGQRWTFLLSAAIAIATIVVFAALGVHIALAGEFQARTIAAMTLRTLFWTAVAIASYRIALKRRSAEWADDCSTRVNR